MASELPPNVAIEQVFVIEATYAPDAAETRRPVRGQHLARLAELRDAGVVIEAGGYGDMSGSMLIVRAVDADAAFNLARDDVYMKSGVWVELRVKAFGRVVRPADLASAG